MCGRPGHARANAPDSRNAQVNDAEAAKQSAKLICHGARVRVYATRAHAHTRARASTCRCAHASVHVRSKHVPYIHDKLLSPNATMDMGIDVGVKRHQ